MVIEALREAIRTGAEVDLTKEALRLIHPDSIWARRTVRVEHREVIRRYGRTVGGDGRVERSTREREALERLVIQLDRTAVEVELARTEATCPVGTDAERARVNDHITREGVITQEAQGTVTREAQATVTRDVTRDGEFATTHVDGLQAGHNHRTATQAEGLSTDVVERALDREARRIRQRDGVSRRRVEARTRNEGNRTRTRRERRVEVHHTRSER